MARIKGAVNAHKKRRKILKLAKGYYKDEGLAVSIDVGAGSVASITRVASGAYDLGDEPADALLRVGRVALGKGTTFGELGRGHVRINLGCPTDYVVDAVDRIDKTVQAVQAQRAGHDQAAG